MIREVLTSSDRIHGLQGLAGTGKTRTLEAIREGAEKSRFTVEGFAPSSKAAGQLREAGISATTLQSLLARGKGGADPDAKYLHMLDESSLASTRQMRSFLEKIGPNDRVLVIGDTRQHQAVDAGRPFQQMQEAGMQTSQLDQIMRQKDPELLKAVHHLASNETKAGIMMLADQERVTEIANPKERIAAIAKDYAARPENTIIVSPDNRSRQQINEAVRIELLARGTLAEDGRQLTTLAHRSDMTGADRTWAARYNTGDVLQYTTGSKAEGIKRDSFATVRSVDVKANTLTVELDNGASVTYDPRRLRGVNAYREVAREFATGDRIQFTAQEKNLGVANRDLGSVTSLEPGKVTVQLDGKNERTISFDPAKMRGFDHGYAVTSHSSQGLTAGRVIANIDTESSRNLINTRLAYVALSRASEDARIYTNNAATLGDRLATDISKTAAVDFCQPSRTEETRAAVQAFKAQQTSTGTELLQQQGRAYEYAHPEHRLAAVLHDYVARPDRTVVIAPDRAERQELTQLIRADLQAQGKISSETRSLPVFIEQHLRNPKLAASYAPGAEIHYRAGSPELYGIAHNSTATVVSTDSKKNLLTVETSAGERVAYDPSQLRVQTTQSKVYREESRGIAVGDRLQFTAPDREQGIRSGDFATVERIAENNALSLRRDNGKTIELNPEQARHIEYGYAVDGGKPVSADRVLATGESLTPEALAAVSPAARELTTYTSDGSGLHKQQDSSLSKDASPSQVQQLQTQTQYQGFSLGLGL